MRIHSNGLTEKDFYVAARKAGVSVVDLTVHGSRSRARAFNFTLSGSGRSCSQWSNSDHQAATWDEWGIVFAHLFDVDPSAHCGKSGYQSAEHYHWVTGDRFLNLEPSQQHKRHIWKFHGRSAAGSYGIYGCKCGAIFRGVWSGHTWAEICEEDGPKGVIPLGV